MLTLKAPKFWNKRIGLAIFLRIFSPFYYGGFLLNRWLFKVAIKTTYLLPVPVIVVGNLTVGGTGKTPIVIALANYLKKAGWHPGIISRGYKSKSDCYPYPVQVDSEVQQVGDEALLLRRKSQCSVVIDAKRVKAAHYLLEHFKCNIIISDDGLQHHALGRDIEIIVVDAKLYFGNGWVLPAGPLRERFSRLITDRFIVLTGQTTSASVVCINSYPPWIKQALIKAIPFRIHIDTLRQVNNPTNTVPIQTFCNQLVHAVAGVGNPQRFFDLLREQGLNIQEHTFADHYFFQPDDLAFEGIIIMTEKDAVKCEKWASNTIWYLPIDAILTPSFLKDITQILSSIIK